MIRIGVDTNVLLRLLVTDELPQHDASVAFFSKDVPNRTIVVNRVVLVELFWTLRSRYKISAEQTLDVIEEMLGRDDFEIEDADLIAAAVATARNGAGFNDALLAVLNVGLGCEHTVTFDKKAAKLIPSMTLLA